MSLWDPHARVWSMHPEACSPLWPIDYLGRDMTFDTICNDLLADWTFFKNTSQVTF